MAQMISCSSIVPQQALDFQGEKMAGDFQNSLPVLEAMPGSELASEHHVCKRPKLTYGLECSALSGLQVHRNGQS